MNAAIVKTDFSIFEIPNFKERMAALRADLLPKLRIRGENLADAASSLVGHTLSVHVAKHMRRTVNPPPETWFALGREKRGYKQYVHFAFAVSRHGVHPRLVLKDEAFDERVRFASQLERRLGPIVRDLRRIDGLMNFAGWDASEGTSAQVEPTEESLRQMVSAAKKKGGMVDIGFSFRRDPGDETIVAAWRNLVPFYELALS